MGAAQKKVRLFAVIGLTRAEIADSLNEEIKIAKEAAAEGDASAAQKRTATVRPFTKSDARLTDAFCQKIASAVQRRAFGAAGGKEEDSKFDALADLGGRFAESFSQRARVRKR